MFTTCRHAKTAVIQKKEDRKILEHIFQRRLNEVYLCQNVQYLVHLDNKSTFVLSDLHLVIPDKKHYIIHPGTGKKVYLTADNFEIVCSGEKCEAEDFINIWNPKERS